MPTSKKTSEDPAGSEARRQKPVPPFVDEVLREWEFIAFFAYDGFESNGRGGVGLEPGPQGTQAVYGPREFFQEKSHSEVLRLVDEYDPAHELVVYFEESGGSRAARIRTPAGRRHPKRVWFFEQLRRVTEEPESLPERLPDWFLDVLGQFQKMAESQAARRARASSNRKKKRP